MRRTTLLLAFVSCLLAGCGVVSLAASAAGAVIDVGAAVVSTGVKVTGKVIEKTIDAVTPGDSAKDAAKQTAEEEAKKK